MDGIRNKYRIMLIVILLIMGVSISAIFFTTLNKAEDTYQDYAKESIIDVKKTFLKDTVNNVILEIERKQDEQSEYFKNLSEAIGKFLDQYCLFSSDISIDFSIKYFENEKTIADFSFIIIEKATGNIVYSNIPQDDAVDPIQFVKTMANSYPVFSSENYAEYDLFWGVSKDIIDNRVKSQIHDEIHNYRFSNDAYIWVNEVINYEGGENYAIRRIHPNLKDTEGMFLSTNMSDIKGNLPYLAELEGVKKDGELFFNYFFKKNNSEIISEKVTYAKLYKEYNWIIAMGVHLDDVQTYVDQTTSQSERVLKKMMLYVAALVLVLILFAFILVSVLEKWYYKKSTKLLIEETYRDPLTNVLNRRAAQKQLGIVWQSFIYTGINSAIIMIDIDDFKKVNDSCGHDKGDLILINTAEIINKHIRSTDILCRWGGEEFLLICNGLREDDVVPFTDKLLHVVAGIEYECNNSKSQITVSMGVSYFSESDGGYSEAVKRADIALYKSKNQGKDQMNIEY